MPSGPLESSKGPACELRMRDKVQGLSADFCYPGQLGRARWAVSAQRYFWPIFGLLTEDR
jgi:hypothetical protein